MPITTEFSSVQCINSFIQPWGLVISNKQQIISKAAMIGLAILSVNYMLPVAGDKQEEPCTDCENKCSHSYSFYPFKDIFMKRCLQLCQH